jgi:hypothetical protein
MTEIKNVSQKPKSEIIDVLSAQTEISLLYAKSDISLGHLKIACFTSHYLSTEFSSSRPAVWFFLFAPSPSCIQRWIFRATVSMTDHVLPPKSARSPLNSLILSSFPPLFGEFRPKRFVLLWHGSRDGFGAQDFHGRCDGRANTLMLILDTNQNIFGGFMRCNGRRPTIINIRRQCGTVV